MHCEAKVQTWSHNITSLSCDRDMHMESEFSWMPKNDMVVAGP